jgi:hypothetical protein
VLIARTVCSSVPLSGVVPSSERAVMPNGRNKCVRNIPKPTEPSEIANTTVRARGPFGVRGGAGVVRSIAVVLHISLLDSSSVERRKAEGRLRPDFVSKSRVYIVHVRAALLVSLTLNGPRDVPRCGALSLRLPLLVLT